MDLPLSNAELAFVLCGVIVMLGALFVWAISEAERSPLMARIQAEAKRRLK